MHGYLFGMTDRPDGFDFEPNGTILAFIDGEKWKLRRPKTGEFKALRLAVRDRDDELNKLQQEAAEATTSAAEAKGEEAGEEEAVRLIAAARDAARVLSDRQEELDQEWVAQVFAALADHSLPEDRDDWPVWLWQADNVGKMLEHWRHVPLARGGK